jgi:hypothetical protein
MPRMYLSQGIVLPPATSTLNPTNSTVGMCLLFSNVESMKLWEAPPLIKTETLCPYKTPLIRKVLYLGTPLIDAKVAILSYPVICSSTASVVSTSMFCIWPISSSSSLSEVTSM